MEEIAAMLRPGDIITHCYTPQIPSVLDERGRLRRGMLEAQARGVIFDVGHANNHFVFDLVRRAMGEGLLPDVISTDLHGRLPATNPVVDLPTTMTKLLALGLPIERVIEATTTVPARAIGWGDRIGRLEAGHEADITVLQLRDEPIELRDSLGSRLVAPERITVRWTIRAGRIAGDPA
jgi:dihydroorotase